MCTRRHSLVSTAAAGTVVRWAAESGEWDVALGCLSGEALMLCAHCKGANAQQRCGACRSMFYCARECQKAGAFQLCGEIAKAVCMILPSCVGSDAATDTPDTHCFSIA